MSNMTNVNKALAALDEGNQAAVVYAILALRDQDHEVLLQQRKQFAEGIREGNNQTNAIITAAQLPYRRTKFELAATGRSVYVLPAHISSIEEFEDDSAATLICMATGRVEYLVKGNVHEVEAILNGETKDGS